VRHVQRLQRQVPVPLDDRPQRMQARGRSPPPARVDSSHSPREPAHGQLPVRARQHPGRALGDDPRPLHPRLVMIRAGSTRGGRNVSNVWVCWSRHVRLASHLDENR
jgi:hypothetical protein